MSQSLPVYWGTSALTDHRAVSNAIDAELQTSTRRIGHMRTRRGGGKQVFVADVQYMDDPYEGVILHSSGEKKNDEHSCPN